MSDIVIKAAGWIGPEGFGNELTGLKDWPAPLADALRRGELEELRWSKLFDSEAQRFARMDWLSRLGLMAVELLDTRFEAWTAQDREQTAVCVETTCGCLTSDAEFLQLPRPSVFAYTLPSTVIGEICIRHRFTGTGFPFLPLSNAAPIPALPPGLRQNRTFHWTILQRDEKLPNIAVVLKEEISRLARKEVKAQTQKLQKTVAQYRREIAALKRQSSALKAQVSQLDRRARNAASPSAAEPVARGLRYSAKSVVSHRRLLGLSAADYGLLVGVTGHTIYKWEHGGARPRQAQIAALASVRGLRKREGLARLAEMRQKKAGPRKKR